MGFLVGRRLDGLRVGFLEGRLDGLAMGFLDGRLDGFRVGFLVGLRIDGLRVGFLDGRLVGLRIVGPKTLDGRLVVTHGERVIGKLPSRQ